MQLVAYAGREDQDWSLGRQCYFRFRRGFGTDAIAEALGISEAEALEAINRQRSKRLNLPSPYGVR